MPGERPDLWRWRRAAPVRRGDRLLLGLLVTTALLLVIRLADWWFRPAHVADPVLFVVLSLAVWYAVARMVLGWVNLLAVRHEPAVPAPAGMSVAIFTTSSPGEPLAMFERTLAACAQVRHPHTTYLLDDTGDPRIAALARRHGAVPLELVGLPGAKAGKINAALRQTTEEFVLVLDPDHLPFPEFLDRVLGYFADDRVGYVQVAQAYYNLFRSFTARGAAEQTYSFYGPTQAGLHGHGAAVAIGANCTFRRRALESVGGHGIGLAEDLVTAIRIHAAGWRSVYVPEVLSRGLVPEDFGSFLRQQLKWARGVYEVLFAEWPAAFRRLGWRQRLAYATIGSYYSFGATMAAFLVIPYLYLWTGLQPAAMRFEELVATGGPVLVMAVAIYLAAQRWLCHPAVERGLHWRGLLLKVACWPVYLAGMVLAILRREIPYIPTAKEARRGPFLRLAAPHLTLVVLYLVTLAFTLYRRLVLVPEQALVLSAEATWAMVGFATTGVVLSLGGIRAAWDARRPPTDRPWDHIPDRLGGEAP